MKIIQLLAPSEDDLIALTDDGRIFFGYWDRGELIWSREITPNETDLCHLPLNMRVNKCHE